MRKLGGAQSKSCCTGRGIVALAGICVLVTASGGGMLSFVHSRNREMAQLEDLVRKQIDIARIEANDLADQRFLDQVSENATWHDSFAEFPGFFEVRQSRRSPRSGESGGSRKVLGITISMETTFSIISGVPSPEWDFRSRPIDSESILVDLDVTLRQSLALGSNVVELVVADRCSPLNEDVVLVLRELLSGIGLARIGFEACGGGGQAR